MNPLNIQLPPAHHEQRPAGASQHPFILDTLAFLTSLGVHVGLIIIGLLTLKVFHAVVIPMVREQSVVVEAPPVIDQSAESVLNTGDGDPTRAWAQDKLPDVPPDLDGLTARKGIVLNSISGGGTGEHESNMIALGPNALLGRGKGIGPGSGTGIGPGSGELGGLAPFGVPRGGSGGTGIFRDPHRQVARKVIYLCDASGTMVIVFGKLREELKRSIEGLRPTQSFNVVLFSEDKSIVLEKSGLLMATPENKRRAVEFVQGVSARGRTNPFPAIREAFRMEPELIHCLTDGFDQVSSFDAVAAEFRRLNKSGVRVNTLLIEGSDLPELRAVLQRIAAENGGAFKALKEGDW